MKNKGKIFAVIGAGVAALVGGILFFVRKGNKNTAETEIETEISE